MIDAKRLSYNITDFNWSQWINEGFKICSRGIREKFIQNKLLIEMLEMTAPKVIAEASNKKLWGTGIRLRDKEALDANKWENPG